jgi:hypothetical protein
MDEPRVTVTAYRRRTDAEVAHDVLDAVGIDSVVEETGASKVRVHNLDAIRAGDALENVSPRLEEIGEADEESSEPTVCASCGSPNIERRARLAVFAGVAAIAIGIGVAVGLTDAAVFAIGATGIYLLVSGRWRCVDCGDSA